MAASLQRERVMRITAHYHRPSEARLLRYLFESPQQIMRHFRAAGERVMLFFPAALPLETGESVILEVAFSTSGQRCMFPGRVVDSAPAAQPGRWIEFRKLGMVEWLLNAAASPKRRHRRFPADAIVTVDRVQGLPIVARLADISAGGARATGAAADAAAGEQVQVRFYADDDRSVPVPAEIAWVGGGELGLRFHPFRADQRFAVASVVEGARKKLVAAHEVSHPAICRCRLGRPIVEGPFQHPVRRYAVSR